MDHSFITLSFALLFLLLSACAHSEYLSDRRPASDPATALPESEFVVGDRLTLILDEKTFGNKSRVTGTREVAEAHGQCNLITSLAPRDGFRLIKGDNLNFESYKSGQLVFKTNAGSIIRVDCKEHNGSVKDVMDRLANIFEFSGEVKPLIYERRGDAGSTNTEG